MKKPIFFFCLISILLIFAVPLLLPIPTLTQYTVSAALIAVVLTAVLGGIRAGIVAGSMAGILNIASWLMLTNNITLSALSGTGAGDTAAHAFGFSLEGQILLSLGLILSGTATGLSSKVSRDREDKLKQRVSEQETQIREISEETDKYRKAVDKYIAGRKDVSSISTVKPLDMLTFYSTKLSEGKWVDEESQRCFSALIRMYPHVMAITDLYGMILYCNREIMAFLGYNPDDGIYMKSLTEFVIEGHRDRIAQNMNKALTDGLSRFVRYSVKTADGRILDNYAPSSIYLELSGEPPLIVAFADYSEQLPDRKAPAKPVWVIDQDGRTIYVSESFAKALDFNALAMTGKYISRYVSEKSIVDLDETVIKCKEGSRSATIIDFLKKDGMRLSALFDAFPAMDAAGKYLGLTAFVEDITDRRQLEDALMRRLSFEETVAGISSGFISVEPDMVYTEITKVMKTLGSFFGVSKGYLDIFEDDETVGKSKQFELGTGYFGQYKSSDGHNTETISIPISFQGRPAGFFRFMQQADSRVWLEEDIKMVGLVGEIIVSTLTRRNAELKLKESEERFRSIIDNSKGWVWEADSRMVFSYVSPKVCDLLGYDEKDVIGKRISDFIEKADFAWLYGMLRKSVELGRSFVHAEILFRHNDQRQIEFESNIVPVKEDGRLKGYRGICTDRSELREMEEKKKMSEERFRITLHSIGDAVITTETNGCIAMLNRVAEDLTGWTAEEAAGKKLSEVFVVMPQYTDRDSVNKEEYNLHRLTNDENIMRMISRNGKTRDISVTDSQIKDDSGTVLGSVLVFRDITEKKQKDDEIKYLSFHDKLTGLFNRAYFEEEMKRLDTKRQYPISLLIGDLNGLKLINDVFGHFEGDRLLKTVADIIKDAVRKEDVVARYGGDEIVVILPKTDESSGMRVRDRILDSCTKVNSGPIQPSISLGLATKTSMEQDLIKVLKEAEDRMYRHKMLEGKSIHSAIIKSLEKTLFERSYETEEHAQRMREMAMRIGRMVSLSDTDMDELSLAAVLHDMGKIGIPDSILTKPGSLNDEEWDEMKKHPDIGYRIAESSHELSYISEAILHHHEHWNGKGYPSGLKGEEIPKISRILTIVDAYDAITHARVYKPARSHQEAMNEIKRCAGAQFDPQLVEIFIQIMKEMNPECE